MEKNELFFKFLCNGCNIYSINVILTKFHHLKTSNNENIEIPKTLTWSVTNETNAWTNGRTDRKTICPLLCRQDIQMIEDHFGN